MIGMKGKVIALLICSVWVASFAVAQDGTAFPCEEGEVQQVSNPDLDEVVAGYTRGVEVNTNSKIILWDEAKKMDISRRGSRKIRIEINY